MALSFTPGEHLPPQLLRAWGNHQAGRHADAARGYQALLQQWPDDARVLHLYGVLHRQCGYLERAVELLSAAIGRRPDMAACHADLALTLQMQGDLDGAAPHAEQAALLQPANAALQMQAATLHALRDDWAGAIPYCERRVALDPADAGALADLGLALQSNDQPARARAVLQRALDCSPHHLQALLNLGDVLEQQGDLQAALASYREAEAGHPLSVLPLARRVQLAPRDATGADLDRLRSALRRPGGEAVHDAVQSAGALFALAQTADARGDAAEAAACLGPANALAGQLRRESGQHYDTGEHTRYVDQLIAGFTPQLFARLAGAGDSSVQPVFVFGMPRSGTTLVEQVLGSHPRIHGAGELALVRRMMDSLPAPAGPLPALAAIEAADLRRLATGYLDGLRDTLRRQGVEGEPARVVDKMPDNYLYLGMIALMFPCATLIHVRRDLRDVALSCWQTRFRSIRWADDMQHLAHRIHNYQRLVDHWRAVLPHRVHEVHYEELVGDFEPQARRLVAACGLDWEPACLDFHRNPRPVRTASLAQVRQPLYNKSVGRWRAYEPWLGELFASLAAASGHTGTV